jgi:hypothetical protein
VTSYGNLQELSLSSTASGAGYHIANVAEHYVHGHLPDNGGFVTVTDSLATATSTDSETITTLTKATSTLTDQLAAKDIWAKSKEAKLKRLLGGRAPAVDAVAARPAAAYVSKSYKTKNDN